MLNAECGVRNDASRESSQLLRMFRVIVPYFEFRTVARGERRRLILQRRMCSVGLAPAGEWCVAELIPSFIGG